jgi:hypothetical protein
LPITTVCPICNPSAQELPRPGDATSFDCPTHGNFKVDNSVFAEEGAEDYTRAALDKAKQRMEPDEEEGPLIITEDFY